MSFSAPGSPPPANPDQAQVHAQGQGHAHAEGHAHEAVPFKPLPGWNPLPVAPRPPRGLSIATIVLLAVSAAYALFLTGTNLYVRSVLEDGQYPDAGAPDSLTPPDVLMALAATIQLPVLLATAVVFIIWFYRAHRTAKVFRPDTATRGSGWAIGGWFIPFGNLVIPCRMARETWEASRQLGPDGSDRPASTAFITWWWLMWLLSLLADRLYGAVYESTADAAGLSAAATVGAVQGVLSFVAALLAIRLVHKLAALQTARATTGPYAAE
ncbi:DUF4328 domain-containing protein [Streptomyces sp. NBC_00503]|uniref:DUF4328 domain-containing protein n=1 Tax=Streptomyces sp. NBC_00503 TaxID=2903659 RepID=UPI002E8021D6|nr:DUF4328 domain-containing protein [Streptomyces sp. NBC_00503]WUD79308.1 DUF4328 domain-containing protein [Streptomyces sp. NBC_00503]